MSLSPETALGLSELNHLGLRSLPGESPHAMAGRFGRWVQRLALLEVPIQSGLPGTFLTLRLKVLYSGRLLSPRQSAMVGHRTLATIWDTTDEPTSELSVESSEASSRLQEHHSSTSPSAQSCILCSFTSADPRVLPSKQGACSSPSRICFPGNPKYCMQVVGRNDKTFLSGLQGQKDMEATVKIDIITIVHPVFLSSLVIVFQFFRGKYNFSDSSQGFLWVPSI